MKTSRAIPPLLLASLALCFATGCPKAPPPSFPKEIPLKESASKLGVSQLKGSLKEGMPFAELLKLLGTTPALLSNGSFHFILKDGELWTRNALDFDKVERVVFWETESKGPDGKAMRESSLDKIKREKLGKPWCVDIALDAPQEAGTLGSGPLKLRFESFNPVNILVELETSGPEKAKASLFLINGKYLLSKGEMPEGGVPPLELLNACSVQFNILNYFLSKGFPQGPAGIKGKESREFGSDTEPLSISLPGGMAYKLPAPWRMSGQLEPSPFVKGFNFKLEFGSLPAREGSTAARKGSFTGSFMNSEKEISDETSLSGWEVLQLSASGEAAPLKEPPKTLGELRAN